MSPGQTGHITGQRGRVPGTDGTHTRGCPAKLLYVYWFFSFPIRGIVTIASFKGGALRKGPPFHRSRSSREIKNQNASCQTGGREVTR